MAAQAMINSQSRRDERARRRKDEGGGWELAATSYTDRASNTEKLHTEKVHITQGPISTRSVKMPKSVFGGAHQDLVRVMIEARKSSGMLQAELGEKVGKDQTYISLIENGQRRVDVLEFIALCRAMKIDPARLFGLLLERVPPAFDI